MENGLRVGLSLRFHKSAHVSESRRATAHEAGALLQLEHLLRKQAFVAVTADARGRLTLLPSRNLFIWMWISELEP